MNPCAAARPDHYLVDGQDFIREDEIHRHLEQQKTPDPEFIRAILQKSLAIETLEPRRNRRTPSGAGSGPSAGDGGYGSPH